MLAAAAVAAGLIAGCATSPKVPAGAGMESPALRAGDRSGVEVVSLRRTAGGQLLDFRYRVVDPEKASPMLLRTTPAYLVHQATGATMPVPETKVGKMRQSTPRPEKGRVYFMLFNTSGRSVSPGDRVTVVVGRHRFENLTVQ